MKTPLTARRGVIGLSAGLLLAGGGFLTVAEASPGTAVTCSSRNVEVARGGVVEFDLECTTGAGDRADSFVQLSSPAHAEDFDLDTETGHVFYRPEDGFNGADGFTFQGVATGWADSAITSVNISVSNDAPVCAATAAFSTVHDTALTKRIACTDANGDPVTLALGTVAATHGKVTVNGRSFTYTPKPGYVGSDSFTLRATDGDKSTKSIRVTLAVTNARPDCADARRTAVHDWRIVIVAKCTDADGDALALAIGRTPANGDLAVRGDKLVFKPAYHWTGKDSFTFVADDGLASSRTARVDVTVTNRAPRCERVDTRVVRRASATVRLHCTDADGDAVALRVTDRPRHGTVEVDGSRVTYTPERRYQGKDAFEVTATDGVARSAARTVSLVVR